ncbi:hypothetical protein HZ326_26101, partial [Fusarium oxysporum f. sp. albedinis]
GGVMVKYVKWCIRGQGELSQNSTNRKEVSSRMHFNSVNNEMQASKNKLT